MQIVILEIFTVSHPAMHLPTEPDLPPQINIVPMIDVVFAVLTFFVMSSLVMIRSEGLPVNLPQAVTAKGQLQEQIVITVDAAGQLTLNRQTISLEQLVPQLTARLANPQNRVVVINADEAVHHGRVVAVMDQIRRIPGVRLAIATKQPR
jgi:biopolymer transport protein ExbD